MYSRLTVERMITQDLGYCCPWAFFSIFRKTAVIAARLGVTTRAVRYVKARCREGGECCRGREGCLREKLEGVVGPFEPGVRGERTRRWLRERPALWEEFKRGG